MRFRASCAAVLLALPTQTLLATTLDLNLNDDAARLTVEVPLQSNLQVDGSWMHHQDEGDVLSVGLHLADRAAGGDIEIHAGIGGRLYYLEPDRSSGDGAIVAIGGFVDYTFPNADRFGVKGYAYYGPDVLATSDIEQYYELGALVRYELLRNADLYLGVRLLKGDFENARDITFDSGPHIGIRLNF